MDLPAVVIELSPNASKIIRRYFLTPGAAGYILRSHSKSNKKYQE
jgi:hypothetical protein